MAGLVVGHQTLAALAHHPVLLLRAGHHALDGIVDLVHGDLRQLAAGGQDGGLVEQVGQIGAGEAGRAPGHLVEIDILGQGLAAGMDAEDLQAAGVVGPVDHHLAIETAGSHQGRIQHVRPVGGGHDDDAGVALEAVHLGEQLVEGLLALVVATAEPGAPLAADGVDLIDEDDAGGVLLGLLEEVAHPAGADTDEHLDELGTGDREEGHTGLPRDGLGEQGLAGAGRAHQQHSFGDLGADGGEAIGILEEVDHLGELELGALDAGHITEGDLGLRFHLHPGLALAEVHGRVAAAALGAPQQEEETTEQQQGEDQAADRLLPGRRFPVGLNGDVDVVVGEQLEQVLVGGQVDHGALTVVLHHLGGAAVGGDQHPGDLVGLHGLDEVAVAEGAGGPGRIGTLQEGGAHRDHHDHQEHVEPRVAPAFLHDPVSLCENESNGMLNAPGGRGSGCAPPAAPPPRYGRRTIPGSLRRRAASVGTGCRSACARAAPWPGRARRSRSPPPRCRRG